MESKGYVKSIPGGDSFLGDSGPTEGSLLAAVLPYVVMIVFLPLASFFSVKSFLFRDFLEYDETTANVYGAVVAVVILHVLLALFILKSFRDTPQKGSKQD